MTAVPKLDLNLETVEGNALLIKRIQLAVINEGPSALVDLSGRIFKSLMEKDFSINQILEFCPEAEFLLELRASDPIYFQENALEYLELEPEMSLEAAFLGVQLPFFLREIAATDLVGRIERLGKYKDSAENQDDLDNIDEPVEGLDFDELMAGLDSSEQDSVNENFDDLFAGLDDDIDTETGTETEVVSSEKKELFVDSGIMQDLTDGLTEGDNQISKADSVSSVLNRFSEGGSIFIEPEYLNELVVKLAASDNSYSEAANSDDLQEELDEESIDMWALLNS